MVLASEPVCICGCDVAAPQQVRRAAAQPLADFFRSFDQQFTAAEWAGIRGAGDEAAQEAQFRWVLQAGRHVGGSCRPLLAAPARTGGGQSARGKRSLGHPLPRHIAGLI